jgi:competence transcription factor ComK
MVAIGVRPLFIADSIYLFGTNATTTNRTAWLNLHKTNAGNEKAADGLDNGLG